MKLLFKYWRYKDGQWKHVQKTVPATQKNGLLTIILPKDADLESVTLFEESGINTEREL